MGLATGEDGLAEDFAVVATKGEPIDLAGEPKEDLDNGELGPLGKVFAEDKSDESLVSLIALVFFFDPLGIGGDGRAVASVTTEEATS